MQRWDRVGFYKRDFIYFWPQLDSPFIIVGRVEKSTAYLTQIVENNVPDISQIALNVTSQVEKWKIT